MLSMHGAIASAFVVAAAGAQPACDLTKSGEEICDGFCNFECSLYNASAGETGEPMNVTLYRITPFNTSGIRNKNTGDAPGDVGFFLSRKNITQQCAKDPSSFGCFLDGDNMYGMFKVEIDGQWGPYEECNPVNVGGTGGFDGKGGWTDTRDFQCGVECLFPTPEANCSAPSPWGGHKNGSSSGMGNPGVDCFCDTSQRQNKAVGRTPKGGSGGGGGYGPPPPAGWPPQCSSGFSPPCLKESESGYGCEEYGGCLSGHSVAKTVRGWDFGSTAAMACDACSDLGDACAGWAFAGEGNRTATVFSGNVTVEKAASCISAQKEHSRYHGGGGRNWYGVDAGPGYWYSTPVAGECAEGVPLGSDGCTWRVAETVKYANASCVDGKVDLAVESHGKVCFDACPQPLNRVSDCYLVCYLNTLTGDPAYNLTKMAPELFVGPWQAAFTEDDPAEGGCPAVTPLPCEGAQCPKDWPTWT